MFIYLAIVTILIPIVILSGVSVAEKFKDKNHLILAFSAGSVFSISLFDLIPEAIELSNNVYSIHTLLLTLALGFFLYLIIDRKFSLHNHTELHEKSDCNHTHTKPKVMLYSFMGHTLVDGILVGMSFKISNEAGIMLGVAIMLHAFSDGINIKNILTKSFPNDLDKILKYQGIYCCLPIIGVIISLIIPIDPSLLSLIAMFLAGLFIYVSVSDLIPESYHKHPKLLTTIMTILGFLTIYLITAFLH